ncbi:MAG: YraN family protein, partial [bacterium]|nr:YraN family protein [bacterium]
MDMVLVYRPHMVLSGQFQKFLKWHHCCMTFFMKDVPRNHNLVLSIAGEDHAEKFLKRQGYRILARRWWSRWGEIDLV